jgi:membrane associated rhomboid family serine protease
VTYALIALNIVAFGLTMVAATDQRTGYDQVTINYSMVPFSIALDNEYYRLLTAMFLHAGLIHIAVNMFSLWIIGPQLETLLGHVRYTALYLVAGLGGSVASFWFSSPNVVGVGASGAIYGLMGALFVVARSMNLDIRPLIGVIAVNVVISFTVPGIDWRAHLGGLVVGGLVAALYCYPPAKGRPIMQVLGVIVILGALTFAVVLRDQQVTEIYHRAIAILGG